MLREIGINAPPVRVEDVLEHLRVHREFYDLENPTFLQRAAHRAKVQAGQLLRLLRDRVRLRGVWLPDEQRILVDAGLPTPKQDWASFHEATHRILPWHRGFFLGDTAQTLDPGFQEALEAEANYGASDLRFCGAFFSSEARDIVPTWTSIRALQKRYRTSLQSTARRVVEFGPNLPMLFVVSTPYWQLVPPDQLHRCRHVVPSPRFTREFGTLEDSDVIDQITSTTAFVRGGPAGEFEAYLQDLRREGHSFVGSHFFNQHDLFTLFVHEAQSTATSVVLGH